MRRQRKERWPPPPPISPEGRIAGLTTTGSVIAGCAAWLVVAFRIAVCTGVCEHEPGLGGLVLLVVALPFVAAIALFRATLIRPGDPDASAAWRFGLSVIFSVGVVAGASWIPSLTCPPGTTLSFFGFCAGEHGARLPTGTENIEAVYRTGLGAAGNVEPGQISQLATRARFCGAAAS